MFSLFFLIFRTSFFLLTFCTFLVGSTSFILSHADHMLCFAHPLGAVGLPPPLPVVCSYITSVSLLLPPSPQLHQDLVIPGEVLLLLSLRRCPSLCPSRAVPLRGCHPELARWFCLFLAPFRRANVICKTS